MAQNLDLALDLADLCLHACACDYANHSPTGNGSAAEQHTLFGLQAWGCGAALKASTVALSLQSEHRQLPAADEMSAAAPSPFNCMGPTCSSQCSSATGSRHLFTATDSPVQHHRGTSASNTGTFNIHCQKPSFESHSSEAKRGEQLRLSQKERKILLSSTSFRHVWTV